jgi:putative ABC transport system permease protein
MRAIGAQRGFIRGLFAVETGAVTLMSGIAGILLGCASVALLDRASLRLNNEVLVLLFGGTLLRPTVSAGNLAISLLASLVLGTIAWVHPVRLALRIQPVKAIHKT